MKKVLLVPDSFKGTLSSAQICAIMERSILSFYPGAQVVRLPVADGGEGSVEAFLGAVGGEKRRVTVRGPWGEPVESFYGMLPDGTAVVEMAAAAGLPLAGERRDPEQTTTYGVGELIAAALNEGCKKLVVGLGGSATNDGGCGAAAALGAVFRNEAGEPFVPVGGTLGSVRSVDLTHLHPALAGVPVTAMCDVDTPLCGAAGAAAVFGPQKGADAAMVARLDAGLAQLAQTVRRDLGKDILHVPGAGAAGGMGGGMLAFLNARLQMGIEAVLDTVGFDALLQGADMVFTGEGKIDAQSLRGKVVIGVARRTQRAGVPLIAVVGDIGDGAQDAYALGVSAIFSTNRVAVPYEQARQRAGSDLALTMDNLMHFLRCMER